MRITERDYRAGIAVMHAVADVSSPDEFAQASLSALDDLVPSDVISLNEVEPGAQRFGSWLHPAGYVIPPATAQVLIEGSATHPLIADYARTGDGSARRISDLLSAETWRAHPLYLGFYAPLGIEFQMSIGIAAPRPTAVAFALNRGGRDFDERDRVVLDLVRPHLAQSWRHARDRARMTQLLSASAGALDDAGTGVVALTDPPHEVTPGALLEVYRFFGRPAVDGVLPVAVDRWIAAQRSREAHDDEALLRPLSATVGRRRLVLRLLPGAAGRPDAVLLRVADVATLEPGLAAVGLSGREAEVLRLVATGGTNAQIGARLHVAPSTVKKHLDAIYRKLGVSGRVRAVAAAAEILAHHPET
jgi:DNA-binding CsgD family transcriptional regulator